MKSYKMKINKTKAKLLWVLTIFLFNLLTIALLCNDVIFPWIFIETIIIYTCGLILIEVVSE